MSLDAYVAGLGPLPPLLTIVGLGDGALLDALDRSGWDGRIVAFEPDTELLASLKSAAAHRRWTEAGRLRVVEGPAYRGGVDACLAFSGGELRALAEPVFADRFAGETRLALSAMLLAVRSTRANAESQRRHGSMYRANTLRNAAALAREGDLAALAGVAAGLPVVIVAAGPSLDSQIDALRFAQSRAVLICADTALRPLLAAGITPHVAMAVDPTTINASHLVDVSNAQSTWLVAEGSVDPHAVAAFRGRVFACRVGRHDPWPLLEERGFAVGHIRAWGSVLTSALDLALQMGATTIAFAGSDLSFSDGRPYCRGTTFEQSWRRIEDWGTPMADQWAATVNGWPLVEEPDVLGRPRRTAPHLLAFRDWIVEQAATCRHVRMINVSGAGILRGEGLEQGTLTAIAAEWPVMDPRAQIAARWSPRPELAERLADLSHVNTSGRAGAERVPAFGTPIEPASGPPPVTAWRQADPVTMPLVRMTIPRERIHGRADAAFTFTFRTRAGRRWMAQRYVGEPRLFEGGTALVARETAGELPESEPGSFAMTLDEVAFKPFGSENPRFDGPPLTLELPADIANYESLPLDFILQHGL